MENLTSIARVEISVICSVLAGVVAFRLLTGQINMSGLLRDRNTGELSPGRAQLLAFTITVAGAMLLQLEEMAAEGKAFVPSGTLALIYAGSNIAYLFGKYRSFTRKGT